MSTKNSNDPFGITTLLSRVNTLVSKILGNETDKTLITWSKNIFGIHLKTFSLGIYLICLGAFCRLYTNNESAKYISVINLPARDLLRDSIPEYIITVNYCLQSSNNFMEDCIFQSLAKRRNS
jgi:hypothetical protein